MKIFFSVLVFLFFQGIVFSQNSQFEELNLLETQLQKEFDRLVKLQKDDEKRQTNEQISKLFRQVLSLKDAFDYPFDSLKWVGKLSSEDQKLRLYTWNLSFQNGAFQYFGFIHYRTNETEYKIIELHDKSSEIEKAEFKQLDATNWFGALYYNIIEQETDSQTFYTLLGWDGNNNFSNKKIIEVLTFTTNNEPQFGAAVFDTHTTQAYYRIIFEYSKRAQMYLRFDPVVKMLVFDHLSPVKPQYRGQFQFYGPDFSFDAFLFENEKWVFRSNINVKNPKQKNKFNNKNWRNKEQKSIYSPN